MPISQETLGILKLFANANAYNEGFIPYVESIGIAGQFREETLRKLNNAYNLHYGYGTTSMHMLSALYEVFLPII